MVADDVTTVTLESTGLTSNEWISLIEVSGRSRKKQMDWAPVEIRLCVMECNMTFLASLRQEV